MNTIGEHGYQSLQYNYLYMVKIIFCLMFSYQYNVSDINEMEELRVTLKRLEWTSFKYLS